MPSRISAAAKHLLGPRLTTMSRVWRRGGTLADWGNLRRTQPFSDQFGFDRGTPIDRFYLDRFLEAERGVITGDVLEIQVASYARRFGHGLRRVDTLDLTPQFSPTYLCDLAEADAVIPSDSYDCFLLPNTLQHLSGLQDALIQALRIVRPGGVILASAANLVRLTSPTDDFWRVTPAGWRLITAHVWQGCSIDVRAHGNCLAVVAGASGLAVEELSASELSVQDDRFPVLTTIKCVKPFHAAQGSRAR
jgi:hypothetical protein